MTQFEDVLETILEEYARRDSEGEFDTWEETDAFVKEKAEVLLAYAKEEPVSEDLEVEVMEYSNTHNDECFDAIGDKCQFVINAFKAGAKWQKEQFEKNRLKHCNSITNEQAKLEQGFLDQHLDKYQRMPTFLDAIEYGMNLQKEQMMKTAKSGIGNNDNYIQFEDGTWIDLDPSMQLNPAFDIIEGVKVKVLVIKTD